jgi:hypothetical protein
MVEVVIGLDDGVQLGPGKTRLGRGWPIITESLYESRREGARMREMRMKEAATAEKARIRREPARL